jgi:hypothetical protein
MEIVELLDRAISMVPDAAVNEAGAKAADAREYLEHNEWEVALVLLADMYEGWQPTAEWWDLLTKTADLLWLADTAAWCRWGRWGRWESIHGVIRAELNLIPSADGGRTTAIPGAGILRPLWDIGRRTAIGQPDLRVARIWVEMAPELPAGTAGVIRLAPLVPPDWHNVRAGQQITMHEGMPVLGTATIIEVVPRHRTSTDPLLTAPN